MSVIDQILTRAAPAAMVFAPSTWNAESQTIEAVASTFADVQRRDSKGLYLERLDPAGLDLSALEGAPLLDGRHMATLRPAAPP